MSPSPAGLLAVAARLPDATDADLLRRVAAGRDDAAFAEVVQRYGSLVWRACRLTAGSAAEDAFQATFLALAKRAGSIRQPAALAGWLDRTARRAALKAKRRDRRPPPPEPALSADPLDRLTARELLQAIDEELARLPDRYRLPVLLCGVDGLSQEEAAARLGWSAGSVKGRLERGRAKLRQRLAARGLTVPAVLGAVAVPPELAAATLAAVRGEVVSDGVRTLVAEVTRMSAFTWLKPVAVMLAVGGAVTWTVAGGPEPPAAPPAPPGLRPTPTEPVLLWTVSFPLDRQDGDRFYAYVAGWSADGRQVAVPGVRLSGKPVAVTGQVRTYAADTGKLLAEYTGPAREYGSGVIGPGCPVADSLTGGWVASAGFSLVGKGNETKERCVIAIWDRTAPRTPKLTLDIPDRAMELRASPDGKSLYALTWAGKLFRWEAATGKPLFETAVDLLDRAKGSGIGANGLALSRDGTLLAVTQNDVRIGFWDAITGRSLGVVDPQDGIRDRRRALVNSNGLDFTPDGRRLITAGRLGGDELKVGVWDVAPPGAAEPLGGSRIIEAILPEALADGIVSQVRVAPDGRTVALACEDGAARLVDLETGVLLGSLPPHTHGLQTAAFSPDGTRLLTAGRDAVRVWDIRALLPTGNVRRKLEAIKQELSRFAGGWELESAQFDGPDRWTEVKPADEAIPVEFTVTDLDPAATPKAVEVRFKRGVQANTNHRAIYDFPDPDTCRFCYAYPEDGPRPAALTADRGSGQALIVLKRVPPKK